MQGGCRADSADGKWFSVGGDWPCLIRINILQPISFSAGGWMDGSGGMDQVGWIRWDGSGGMDQVRFPLANHLIGFDSIEFGFYWNSLPFHVAVQFQSTFRALSEHFQGKFKHPTS